MSTPEEPKLPAGDAAPTNPPTESNPVSSKTVHSLVLDTGPLIKNDPPVSTLLSQAQELYTLPSVISEIRDAVTRARVETTLLPFLKLRSPRPESIKFVADFARRTGDLEVLSRPDLHLLALTYELECERNGGDWRLRKTPGQKGLNGKAPARQGEEKEKEERDVATQEDTQGEEEEAGVEELTDIEGESEQGAENGPSGEVTSEAQEQPAIQPETVTEALDSLTLEPSLPPATGDTIPDDVTNLAKETHEEEGEAETEEDSADDDGGGDWITPSNLKKHQDRDRAATGQQQPAAQRFLQAALLTADYAMQNVALRMNLNLVSAAGLARITRVKTWALRCHGCFQVTRDTGRQFCPRCGQATLTRVSCTTDGSGAFTVHLKQRGFQWNNRGNVYSVPKPTHGSASGKAPGGGGKAKAKGGKGGWGRELILAEDQKEYVRKTTELRRARARDLMDDDYLPAILTGDRGPAAGARVKVGAGRNVNSRRR
ncbi:D-site 20S pre-rRNA nuclease [Durotheca rogersii]|uniref:D-site 20S pre-rRNA nuclease n=1 Tax=Durotheca rogersii TaxID=419775 RepID=UPI00221F1745|nr:D-site 20S pre-rRNA nuclease [Durotheca rogersii]KAI5859414.1 D-site 20S pre-rRNA nuclease [Durotheca rogersii]